MSQTYKELKEILPKDLAREIITYNTPKSDYITDVCHAGLSELITYVDDSRHLYAMSYFAYRWDMKDLKSTIAQIYPDKTSNPCIYHWCIYGAIDRGDEQAVMWLLEEIDIYLICDVTMDILKISIRCNYDNITKLLLTHLNNNNTVLFTYNIIMLLLYHDNYDMYNCFINMSNNNVDINIDEEYYGMLRNLIDLNLIETNKTIERVLGNREFKRHPIDDWLIAFYTNDKKTISSHSYVYDMFNIYSACSDIVKSPYETEILCHIIDHVSDLTDIYLMFERASKYRRVIMHVDILIKICQTSIKINSPLDIDFFHKKNIEITGDIMKIISYIDALEFVPRVWLIRFILNNINTSHLRNKTFCNALRSKSISDDLDVKEDNYRQYLNFY